MVYKINDVNLDFISTYTWHRYKDHLMADKRLKLFN